MRRLSAALLGGLLVLAGALPAAAAPQPATLDDVLAALEITTQPSDYVIVVDTSLSMREDDRYATVLAALGSTLEQLQPADHIALITFDDGARPAFQGPLGENPQAVLATLPRSPSGQQTDIGAGLDLGIAELERPDAKPVGALVLVTDGEVDTKPDSPFAQPTSPGWDDLRERAAGLQGQIASYALALDANTDAGLMTSVFPATQQIPVAEFAGVLGDLRTELLAFQAQQRLAADIASGTVTAEFAEAGPLGPGTHDVLLRLASTYELIPLHVTGLTAERSGTAPIAVEGLPAEVDLAPQATVELPLQVTVEEWSGLASTLDVSGTASSAWAQVINEDMRTPFQPAFQGAQLGLAFTPEAAPASPGGAPAGESVPASPALQVPWGMIAGIVGAALAAALLLAILVRKRPKLDGSLAVLKDGRVVQELLLTGGSTTLASSDPEGPTGNVSAMTGNRNRVFVKAQAGDAKARARLADGEKLQVGPYELVYTAKRTRVLEMIAD